MTKRFINVVFCAISLALLIAMPIRNLFFGKVPTVDRGDSFVTTSWIMPGIFGSAALVLGIRAMCAGGKA